MKKTIIFTSFARFINIFAKILSVLDLRTGSDAYNVKS